jgi:hypothetical protein
MASVSGTPESQLEAFDVPLMERLDITGLTLGIVNDLNQLRAGKISVADARARAELAKQALRAVGYVIQAQRFLSEQARELAAIEAPAE